MTAKQLIELTVKHTISELKRAGMIRENKLNSYQKTEKVLYEYPKIKKIVGEYEIDGLKITREFVRLIDDALAGISDDPNILMCNPLQYLSSGND